MEIFLYLILLTDGDLFKCTRRLAFYVKHRLTLMARLVLLNTNLNDILGEASCTAFQLKSHPIGITGDLVVVDIVFKLDFELSTIRLQEIFLLRYSDHIVLLLCHSEGTGNLRCFDIRQRDSCRTLVEAVVLVYFHRHLRLSRIDRHMTPRGVRDRQIVCQILITEGRCTRHNPIFLIRLESQILDNQLPESAAVLILATARLKPC